MVAKAATPSKKTKAAADLKSPKTPKADKAATTAKKIQKKIANEGRLKTGLDAALVQKATEALIKYHETKSSDSKSLLGDDQPIQVQFTLLRAPETPSPKPVRIVIPHPFFHLKSDTEGKLEEPEVCLIVKEESKPWCQEMIERFPEHMGCIKKVLGLQSLRTKYARYEQRRALLNKFNFFMADDRILPMLSKALGKDFYQAKKLPVPIALTRKEALPFAIQNALSATYMSISKGTCIMIRAGTTAMPPQQLTENIVQIAAEAVPKMPLKWANIQNIAIKTPESVSLPIYNKTPDVLREIAILAGVVQTIDEFEKEPKTIPAKDEVKKEDKKREIKSPLLRALKKQKQDDDKSKTQNSNQDKPKASDKAATTPKKRQSLSEESTSNKAESTEKAAKKVKKVTEATKKDDEKPKKENLEKEGGKKVETPKSDKKAQKDGDSAKKEKEGGKKVETPMSDKKTQKDGDSAKKEKEGGKKVETPKSDKKAQKDGDSAKKTTKSEASKSFIAAKKFQGSKKGYVFKLGKEGLGYYVDVKPVVDQMAMDALMRAAKGKGNRGGPKKNKQKGARRW